MTEVTKSSDEILSELFDSFKKDDSAGVSNGSATPKSSKEEHSRSKKKHKKDKRHKSDEKERHKKKKKCKRHKKRGDFSVQTDKSSKSKKKKKRRHSSGSDESVVQTKRSDKNKNIEFCNKENSEPEEKILKDVVKSSSVNSPIITCDTSSIPLPPSIGETDQILKVAQEIPEVKTSQISEVFEKQSGNSEKLVKKSFLQGTDRPKMSIKIGNLKNSLVLEAAEEAKFKVDKYEEGEIVDETSEESLRSPVKDKTESVSDNSSGDDKKKHKYPNKSKKRENIFDLVPKSLDQKSDIKKQNDKNSASGGTNGAQNKNTETLEKEKYSENDSRLHRQLSVDHKNLKNKKSRQLRERKVNYSSSDEDNNAVESPTSKLSGNKETASKRKRRSKTKSGGNDSDTSSSSESPKTKKCVERSSVSKDTKTYSKSRKNSVSNRNSSPEIKAKLKHKGSKSRGRSSSTDRRTISKDRKSRSTSRSKYKKSRSVSRSRKSRSPVLSKRKSRSPSRYRNRKSRSQSRVRQMRSLSQSKTQIKRSRSHSKSRLKKSKSPPRYRRKRSRSSSRAKGKRSRSLSRSRGRKSRSLSRSRRRTSRSRSKFHSYRSTTRRSRSKSRRSSSKNRSYSARDNSKSRSRSLSRNRSSSKLRHSRADKRSLSKNKISESARSKSRDRQSRSRNSKFENIKDKSSRLYPGKYSEYKESTSDIGDGSSSDSDSRTNSSKLKKSKRKQSGSKKLKDINTRLLALSSTKIKSNSTSEESVSDSDSVADKRDKKKSFKEKNSIAKKGSSKEKYDSKKIKVKEDKTSDSSDFSKAKEDVVNDSVEFKPKINLSQKIHYSLIDDEPIAMTESEMKILNAKKKSLSKAANLTPSSSDIVRTKDISAYKKFKSKGDIKSEDEIVGIASILKPKNENISKKVKAKDFHKKSKIQESKSQDSLIKNEEIEDSSIKNIRSEEIIERVTIQNINTISESFYDDKIGDFEIKKQTETLHDKAKKLLFENNDKINKIIVQEQKYMDTLNMKSVTSKIRSIDTGSENELSRTANSYDSDGQRSDTAMRNMLLCDKSYSDSDDGNLEKEQFVFPEHKLKYSEESSSETDEEKTFFGITKDSKDNPEENNLKSEPVVKILDNSSDIEESIVDKNITDSDEDIIHHKKVTKIDLGSVENSMVHNKKDFPIERFIVSVPSENNSLLKKCDPRTTSPNGDGSNLKVSDIKLPNIEEKSEKEVITPILKIVNQIGDTSSSSNICGKETILLTVNNSKNISPKRTSSQDFIYEYEKSEMEDEKLDFDEDKSSESAHVISEQGIFEKPVPNLLQLETSVEESKDVMSFETTIKPVNITSEPLEVLDVEKFNTDWFSASSIDKVSQIDDKCKKNLSDMYILSDAKEEIKTKEVSKGLSNMNAIPVPFINKLEASTEIPVPIEVKMSESLLSVANYDILDEPTDLNKHFKNKTIENEKPSILMLKEENKSRNSDSPDDSKTSSDSQNFSKQISPPPKIKSVSRSRSRSKVTKTSNNVRRSKSSSLRETSTSRKSKSKDRCSSRRSKSREKSRRSKSREKSRRSKSKDRSLLRRSKSKEDNSHSRKKKSKSPDRNSHSKGRLSRSREKRRSRDRRSQSGSGRSRSKDKSSRLRDRRSREQRSRSRRRASSHSRRRSRSRDKRSRSRKINQSRSRDKRSRSRERRKRTRSRDKRSRSRGRRNRSRSRNRRSRSGKRRGRSESSRDKRSRSNTRKVHSRNYSKERSRSKGRTKSNKDKKSNSRSKSPEKDSLVICNSHVKKSISLSRSCSIEKLKPRCDEINSEKDSSEFKGYSLSPKTKTFEVEDHTSSMSKSQKKKYSSENEDCNLNSSSDKSHDESCKEKSSSPSKEINKMKCGMKRSRSRSNSVDKQVNDRSAREQKLRSPDLIIKRSRSKSQSKQKSKEKRGRSTRSKSKDRSKEVKTKVKERKSRSRERKSKEEKNSKSHRKRSRSKSKEKVKPRDKRSRSHERRSKSREKISRRSRTRSRSRRRKSDKKERSRRSRSRSKSRSRKRSKKSRSRSRSKDEFFIDKSKLLEIARKNALSMMKQGAVGMDLNKVTAITAGGKTVDELTDFCKLLSQKDATGQESVSSESSSENESEKPFHHPFQLKERSNNIIMNIRNCASLPVKTLLEKTTENALQLRLQFPVSSGQLHRKSENEWIPVSPKKMEEPKSILPAPLRKQEEETTSYPGLQETVNFSNIPLPNSIPQAQLLQPNMTQISNPYPQPHDSGLFTGTTGARFLSQAELASGQQAWAKKDQLICAQPVFGGMGMSMLQKMGWKPGEGLGKRNEGTLEPLKLPVKMDKRGLLCADEIPQPRFRPHNIPKSQPTTKTLEGKHPVSLLVEYCTRKHFNPPMFTVFSEEGPAHKKNFVFKVTVNGVDYQPPVPSPNKKQAKSEAAVLCLRALGLLPNV